MMPIRPLLPGEEPALWSLYRRAVQEGTAAFYSKAQRTAWAGDAAPPEDWAPRLAGQITLVAVPATGAPAGFMTLGRDGHLDLVYVAPEFMGQGVAAALHDRILATARALRLARLHTEASHPARRFFLKHGWREIAEQRVARQGSLLTNFRMEHVLLLPDQN